MTFVIDIRSFVISWMWKKPLSWRVRGTEIWYTSIDLRVRTRVGSNDAPLHSSVARDRARIQKSIDRPIKLFPMENAKLENAMRSETVFVGLFLFQDLHSCYVYTNSLKLYGGISLWDKFDKLFAMRWKKAYPNIFWQRRHRSIPWSVSWEREKQHFEF